MTNAQIGVYVVYERFEHTNRSYETASAFTTIVVEPGAYPVTCRPPTLGEAVPGSVSVAFEGVCKSSYFPGGGRDGQKGQRRTHFDSDYAYNVAKKIALNPDSAFVLFDGYKAQGRYVDLPKYVPRVYGRDTRGRSYIKEEGHYGAVTETHLMYDVVRTM